MAINTGKKLSQKLALGLSVAKSDIFDNAEDALAWLQLESAADRANAY